MNIWNMKIKVCNHAGTTPSVTEPKKSVYFKVLDSFAPFMHLYGFNNML
jgi:hypothetical protein